MSLREVVASCFAAALLGVSVQCGVARAAEFSWEVGATQRDIDDDNDSPSEVTRSTLEATYHFGAADDESGPYALATFLSRTSRVAVAVNRDVLRVLTAPPSKGGSFRPTEESTDYSVAGRYFVEEAGWYVGGALASSETDHLREFPYSSDRTAYGIVGGKYVAASTSVELGAYATRSNVEQSVSGCTEPCVRSAADRDTDELRLSSFHLGTLGQWSYALSGSVATIESEIVTTPIGITWHPEPPLFAEVIVRGRGEEAPTPATFALLPHDRYAISWEVFPTRRLGIRVGYTRWRPNGVGVDDLPDGDAYDLTGTWFVTRRVSAALMVISGSAVRHSDYNEIDSVALRVLGRF